MRKIIQDFEVADNKRINNTNFILKLISPSELPDIYPGQFAQILIPDSKKTFLRRPFSIYDFAHKNNTVSFFIKCVGEGTLRLSTLKKGDIVNVMLPLGNYFGLDIKGNVLLVGGGCGIAPVFYLAKCLQRKNINIDILAGIRTKEDLVIVENLAKFGNIHITTEDGSAGEKGLVTAHSILKNNLSKYSKFFCCGPEAMMKAIASIAKENSITCEVSLENTMACGIGACLCCVTDTIDGHKCVCTDGPVFNINSLKWQI